MKNEESYFNAGFLIFFMLGATQGEFHKQMQS